MKIEAFVIVWNEIDTIHLTIKHYQRFCDVINVFDNYSNDGTFEKCQELGCNVQRFGQEGVLDDTEYLKIKNHAWKGSDADWVVVVDSDEILWRPDIKEALQSELDKGSTIFKTFGFNIYSHEMPVNDFLEIRTGVPDKKYSKKAIFSPKIREIGYIYGCHEARPRGGGRYTDELIPLFHYRNIGGPDRLSNRHKIYRDRLSKKNKAFKLGFQYLESEEQRINYWHEQYRNSIPFGKIDILWMDGPDFQQGKAAKGREATHMFRMR